MGLHDQMTASAPQGQIGCSTSADVFWSGDLDMQVAWRIETKMEQSKKTEKNQSHAMGPQIRLLCLGL
jgi:hypothetical protein